MHLSKLCVSILFIGLSSMQSEAQIITVKGPIEPREMGATLIHEHVMVDWVGADSTGYHRWDKDKVVERVLPFLKEAKELGVRTFIDCTPALLGRDPFILKKLSEKSGLHILTNTGYYGAKKNTFIPEQALQATAEKLAGEWIDEFEKGIDSSGIRPGFIKISVDRDSSLSQMHQKLVRAAALTHLRTGLTIVSHTGPDSPALAQMEILKEMGVSSKAFVWTHAQSGTLQGYLEAAEQGAWISLDNVSKQPERIAWFVKTLSELKTHKVLSQVLISHDAGWYDVGQEKGGDFRPYNSLFTHLVPELKKHGFTQNDIDMLLVENPKRAYTVRIRTR